MFWIFTATSPASMGPATGQPRSGREDAPIRAGGKTLSFCDFAGGKSQIFPERRVREKLRKICIRQFSRVQLCQNWSKMSMSWYQVCWFEGCTVRLLDCCTARLLHGSIVRSYLNATIHSNLNNPSARTLPDDPNLADAEWFLKWINFAKPKKYIHINLLFLQKIHKIDHASRGFYS